jgi:peptidoglycan/xylan/chitin deacetylase (PgdA/CDA1 family)
MPTFSKRHHLANGLRRLGLLWALARCTGAPALLVLNYHRIGSVEGHPLDDGVMSATEADFRAQVRFLRGHFDLPPLEAVMSAAEQGFRFSRPTALITFDDGYRDNFELALPILREAGVPAVLFICPHFVVAQPLPFWDFVAYVLKKTTVKTLTLTYPFEFHANLEQESPRAAATRLLTALGNHRSPQDEPRFFEHLQERGEVQVPLDALRRHLFMSWDEVRQAAAAGLAIGSHTLTHPVLAHQSEDEQRREMIESKRVLEEQLGQPVETIAYPFGQPDCFSDVTKRLAQEAGYRLGFSYYGGINRPSHADRFDVNRVAVDYDLTMPLFQARTIFYRAFGKSFF